MGTVYVFFADGFEEIEAFTSVDVMRRAGLNVEMGTVTEYICDTGIGSRHTKTGQIKCIALRHNRIAIGLYEFVIPVGIQIQTRIQ